MKFERTDKYMQKLFLEALDEKNVISDATITIVPENGYGSKLKAYCSESKTYLQFPRNLRDFKGQRYIADVIQVIREDDVRPYYRVVKCSIRKFGSDEVIA